MSLVKGANSKLEVSRRLLSGRFEAEYTLRLEIDRKNPDALLAKFVTSIFEEILPRDVFFAKHLKDIQGRSSIKTYTGLEIDWPNKHRIKPGEIIYLIGTLDLSEINDQDEQDQEESPNLQDFSLIYTSSFHGFEGAHHILNSIACQRHGLPEDVPSDQLIQIPNIRIDALRIGLEFFESRFSAFSLGYSPVVTQSLYIEYLTGNLCLRIQDETLRQKQALPILPKLEVLNRIFKEVFDFDLIVNYSSKLE